MRMNYNIIMMDVENDQSQDKFLKDLIEQGRDYMETNGLMFRDNNARSVYHINFTLFPSPFPKHCFEDVQNAQKVYNRLMHRVAEDEDFLMNSLKNVMEVDDFTKNLWHLYSRVRKEKVRQPVWLELNRSDYMACSDDNDWQNASIKQVEFNTISVAAVGMMQRINPWHRYSLNMEDNSKQVVWNNPCDGLAEAIITAWQLYQNPNAAVLFLVLKEDCYILDQRMLEYTIRKKEAKCRIIRRTLQDVGQRGSLTDNYDLVMYHDNTEIAVAYQRCCYDPSHFTCDKDWETRFMIERSRAIKCPTIQYHLAGAKKVQQVLAVPGVLEKFLNDPKEVELIRSTQAGQYSLDLTEEGDSNAEMAIKNPESFVLKPQREGGGNNIFGKDISVELISLKGKKAREGYILMDKLSPLRFQNYIVKHNQDYFHGIKPREVTSEIGIYGSVIGNKDNILHNAANGYFVRTSVYGTNGGGVRLGTAARDSLYTV